MRRQPRSRICGGDVTLWNVTSEKEILNENEEPELPSTPGDYPFRKHFFYVGTPKRIQEITEEERLLRTHDIQIPQIMHLDRDLPSERNTSSLHRNSFLTQPSNYSRHRGTQGPPRVSNNTRNMLKIKGAPYYHEISAACSDGRLPSFSPSHSPMDTPPAPDWVAMGGGMSSYAEKLSICLEENCKYAADGAGGTRWPQKTLTNQMKASLSGDPEDVPHP